MEATPMVCLRVLIRHHCHLADFLTMSAIGADADDSDRDFVFKAQDFIFGAETKQNNGTLLLIVLHPFFDMAPK